MKEEIVNISEIITKFEQKSQAMAYSRNDWINKLEEKLTGALGEYAKQKYADLVGFKGQ